MTNQNNQMDMVIEEINSKIQNGEHMTSTLDYAISIRESIKHFDQPPTELQILQFDYLVSTLKMYCGDLTEGVQASLEKCYETSKKIADDKWKKKMFFGLMNFYLYSKQYHKMSTLIEQVEQDGIITHEDLREQAHLATYKGMLRVAIHGDYETAITYYNIAMSRYLENDDEQDYAIALTNIGDAHARLRQFEDAKEHFERALCYLSELPRNEFITKKDYISSLFMLGEYGKAKEMIEEQFKVYVGKGLVLENTYKQLETLKEACNVLDGKDVDDGVVSEWQEKIYNEVINPK